MDKFELEKLELRNLSSMRVSNRIIPPSESPIAVVTLIATFHSHSVSISYRRGFDARDDVQAIHLPTYSFPTMHAKPRDVETSVLAQEG